MADVVTTTIIENGPRWLVMRFTNLSDGTGEAGVVKVNAASATYGVNIQGQIVTPGVHLKVREIDYDVGGMKLQMLWDGTVPQECFTMSGYNRLPFDIFGGLTCPGVAVIPGTTGSLLFTTSGQTAGSTYSVVLRMSKGVPQGPF